MRAIICVLAFSLALVSSQQMNNRPRSKMDTVFQWRYIDFQWPSMNAREQAIRSGRYNASQVIPMDVDKDRAGRVFLTFLGNSGTPANLGIVSNMNGAGGPLIRPYPNWSWFQPDNCSTIQNVFRMKIDDCNRLWVLDNGQKDGQMRRCPPKLLVFDLNINILIQSLVIPDSMAKNRNGKSLLATVMVDSEGRRCENTTVYLADSDGNGLVVMKNKMIFRYEHSTFLPDPKAVMFRSGNDVFPLNGGIVGLAISPRTRRQNKQLFYRPLNSFRLHSVAVNGFRREGIDEKLLQTSGDILPSQAVTMAFSRRGTLFFGLTAQNAIGCWNKFRPRVQRNIKMVDQNLEQLRFLSGVKVIKPSRRNRREELLVLSNNFVAFRANTLIRIDIKFRILVGSVDRLVRNTECDAPRGMRSNSQDEDMMSEDIVSGDDVADGDIVDGHIVNGHIVNGDIANERMLDRGMESEDIVNGDFVNEDAFDEDN